MCWSWEVSLSFSLFEFLCIWLLYRRNKFLDRNLATLQIPVAVQEFIQFVIWSVAVDDNNNNDGTCSALNKSLTYIQLFVIMSIPVYYSYFYVFKTYKNEIESSKHLKQVSIRLKSLKIHMIVQIIFYAVYCLTSIFDDVLNNNSSNENSTRMMHCTYVTKSGHLLWLWLDYNVVFEKIVSYLSVFFYLLSAMFSVLFRPMWIALPPCIYSVISALLFRIYSGREWGSLWCWACAVLVLWYIVAVYVAEWLVKHYKQSTNKLFDIEATKYFLSDVSNSNHKTNASNVDV